MIIARYSWNIQWILVLSTSNSLVHIPHTQWFRTTVLHNSNFVTQFMVRNTQIKHNLVRAWVFLVWLKDISWLGGILCGPPIMKYPAPFMKYPRADHEISVQLNCCLCQELLYQSCVKGSDRVILQHVRLHTSDSINSGSFIHHRNGSGISV